jgi:hypothetical protein
VETLTGRCASELIGKRIEDLFIGSAFELTGPHNKATQKMRLRNSRTGELVSVCCSVAVLHDQMLVTLCEVDRGEVSTRQAGQNSSSESTLSAPSPAPATATESPTSAMSSPFGIYGDTRAGTVLSTVSHELRTVCVWDTL